MSDLAVENIDLPHSMAKQLKATTRLEFDELVSIGMETLAIAAKDFNGKGDFVRYVKQRIRFRVIDAMRKDYRKPVSVELRDYDTEEEVDAFDDVDLNLSIKECIESERWRIIFFLRYHCGWTQEMIAEYLGVDHSRVSHLLTKIHKKIAA